MAAFDDSDDIKIGVTADSKDAIESAKALAIAFKEAAKAIDVDFKSLARTVVAFSKLQVAEVKAASAEELAAIRAKSAAKVADLKKTNDAFKETQETERAKILQNTALEVQQLRKRQDAYKQFQTTRRAQIESSYQEEIQKLQAVITATKEAENTRRVELRSTAAVAIQNAKNEAKAIQSASNEKIAAARSQSANYKAELQKDIKQFQQNEATKRAEIKITTESLRLEAAKIRQATAAAQMANRGEATGKTSAFGNVLNLAPQLASIVFLAEKSAQGVAAISTQVFRLAEAGNRVQALSTAFSTLQQSVGRDPEQSIQRLRQATQGLISDTNLYQKANQAVLLGVPAKLFEESAEAAVKLGRAMGIDAVNALESLSIGLGRQSRLYLDNLGIVVSATEAYSNFARENKILGRELTDAEKRLAFFNETSRQLRDGLSRLPSIQRDVGIAFTELKTAASNAEGEFLRAFNTSEELQDVFGVISTRIKELTPLFAKLGQAAATVFARLLDYERLPPIFKGVVDALGFAGNKLDEFLVLSDDAKRARFKELGEEIAKLKNELATSTGINPRAEWRKQLKEAEAEFRALGVQLDIADTKLQRQRDAKIDVKINMEQLTADIAETETAANGLKTKIQESLGLIKIPGIDQAALDAAVPKLDSIFKQINSGKIKAEEAGTAVESFFNSFSKDINQTNINLVTKKLKEARGALEKKPGDPDLAVDVAALEKELDVRQKSVGLELKQREQLLKLVEERQKVQKKLFDEEQKNAANATKAAKKEADALDDLIDRLRRSLEQSIPKETQEELVSIFNDPNISAAELVKKVEALGIKFRAAKGDVTAFAKEVEKLKDIKDEFPDKPILIDAENTKRVNKEVIEYNRNLKEAQRGTFNLRDLIYGESTDASGKKKGGGFFGFDISEYFGPEAQSGLTQAFGAESFAGFEAMLGQKIVQALADAINLGITLAIEDFTRDDAPELGAQIGETIAGPIGGAVGRGIGEAIKRNTGDLASTKERKKIDAYFSDAFSGERLNIVISNELRKGIAEATNGAIDEAQSQFVRLSGIVFEGFTRFAGDVDFGGENFRNYFNTLSADIQQAFFGVGFAIGELQGFADEQLRLIGIAITNNVGGSIENLRVLVAELELTFEELSETIVKAFLSGKLSIDEAYSALLRFNELAEAGIPGVIGAYERAIGTFNTAFKENNPGRIINQSLRDFAVEAEEAGLSFDDAIRKFGAGIGLTADQIELLVFAIKNLGIDSFEELAKAGDITLLNFIKRIKEIKDGVADTKEEVAQIGVIPEPAKTTPTPSGARTSRGKSPQEIAKDLLKQQRDEARRLLETSQEYLAVIEKVNKRQISLVEAGKSILALEKQLFEQVKQRDAFQKAFDKELGKGRRADKALLADLAAAIKEIEDRLKKATEAAKGANRQYTTLNITGVLPLIKSQNDLALIARQVGVDLQKNVDILVKGFIQGRLSISEVNDQIKKTKELLGPGIPNAVGAVTQAFQNLLNAGEQGGQFSLDAFTDIFAEFREKFNKEGSALRKAQGDQLRQNLDAANAAARSALGPEALEAANKTLQAAEKALKDFYAQAPVPDLANLRVALENTFDPKQIALFFQALGESGLSTFEDFEKAGDETIITILGRLKELGFQFGTTSDNVKGINQGLQDAEKSANAGLDPLKEAIELVKQFNNGAESLPPVFDATTDAIDKLNGPLTALSLGFQGLIEKLGQLSGLEFKNDVVFNVRTTGEAGGRALVELIFGDGSDISSGTGGDGPGLGGSNTAASERARIRLEMAKLRKNGLTEKERRQYNKLKAKLKGLGG